jgi:hypothetical protein
VFSVVKIWGFCEIPQSQLGVKLGLNWGPIGGFGEKNIWGSQNCPNPNWGSNPNWGPMGKPPKMKLESSWNYDYKLRPTANTIFEILSEELEEHKKFRSTFWGRINTCFFSRDY